VLGETGGPALNLVGPRGWKVGLHTILLSPILYGVWYTNGGSGEGVVYCAMVVQWYCKRVGFAGGGAVQG